MRKKSSKGSGLSQVAFRVCAQTGCAVYVAGTFNDWNPCELKLAEVHEGLYQTQLRLPPGRHEYKFLVNQVWHADPNCTEVATNGHGSLNSVIQV